MVKAVKSIFGGGKVKAPPAPPPPPDPNVASEKLAAEAQAERLRAAAGGRASTMLTGGEGVEEEANTAKKRLLGA
jgi:hypothetical protein